MSVLIWFNKRVITSMMSFTMAGWESSLRIVLAQKTKTARLFAAHLTVGIMFLAANTTILKAAELIMFEEIGCMWCERWNEEIGVIYDRTSQGRIAPLRRLNAHSPLPPDLRALDRSSYTPTFVLVENGQDLGRILGYPGENFFWDMLDKLIAKLPPGSTIEPAAPDPATRASSENATQSTRQLANQ